MKLKNTLLISSYVLLAALLFSGAYVVGKTGMTPDRAQPAAADVKDEAPIEEENITYSPEYEVIYEEGKIIIYKCIGNIRSVITSENVSESIFPREDIEALRKGVRFDRLENAQQMFENFVS